MLKFMKQWLPSIMIAVVISLFIRTYVAEAMRVPTGSMIPTIQINDRLIVEKMLWMTTLEHGDIVVFTPPVAGDENKRYVKRLMGLPGDTLEIKDGELYRNGRWLTNLTSMNRWITLLDRLRYPPIIIFSWR